MLCFLHKYATGKDRQGRDFFVRESPDDRAVNLAKHIIETNDTVRKTAKIYGVSKSTVHKDVTSRLKKINKALYNEVKKVLETNKSERHIRGGIATREKFKKAKE